MTITGTIDTSRANAALAGLRAVMIGKGMDASNIVVDELRFLSRTIVNFTPPLGPGGRAAGAKEAGEGAIARELKNLISQAKPEFISEVSARWGLKDVSGFTESAERTPLALKFDNVDPDGSRLIELHTSYRNDRTGKVPLVRPTPGIWTSRVVAPQGTREPFIKQLQERLGMWKATWAYAATLVGASFPRWISRHFGTVSSLAIADISHIRDPQKPYVIFGSRFSEGNRIRQRVRDAVNLRVKVIARKAKLMLSDYKRDMAQGIRAQSASAKHNEPEPIVS